MFSRKKIVLSSYQALKFTNFSFGWCRNWSFLVQLCSSFASQKRRRSGLLLHFTWRRWYISDSDSEWKCHSWKEREQGRFQNLNVRSCKGCRHRLVLLMGLCATEWKLAICQYQTWHNFCVQNLPLQNLLLPHVNSNEWRHLLDLKMNFGVWIWHTLLN